MAKVVLIGNWHSSNASSEVLHVTTDELRYLAGDSRASLQSGRLGSCRAAISFVDGSVDPFSFSFLYHQGIVVIVVPGRSQTKPSQRVVLSSSRSWWRVLVTVPVRTVLVEIVMMVVEVGESRRSTRSASGEGVDRTGSR